MKGCPIALACVVIATALTSTALAQEAEPKYTSEAMRARSKDFTGKWIVDVEKTAAANAGRPAQWNLDGMPIGMATDSDITVTIDEKTLTVVSSTPVGLSTDVYNFNGSEARSPASPNPDTSARPPLISTAQWEGAVLVVKQLRFPIGATPSFQFKYWMDGGNLKCEISTFTAVSANTTITYLRADWTRTIIYRRAGEFGAGAYYPGADIENPALLRKVEPEYTNAAKGAKIEGEVELEAIVLPNGRIGDIRVIRSLDRAFGLDAKAIEAARKWMFKPGTRAGTPVPVIVRLILEFRLH